MRSPYSRHAHRKRQPPRPKAAISKGEQIRRARVNTAIATLRSEGLRCGVYGKTVAVVTAKYNFVFDEMRLTRAKVWEFVRWYQSYRNSRGTPKLPPIGVSIVQSRDWSKVPGAHFDALAPASPIRISTFGAVGGSDSTVPGHLTELTTYDLQKR